MWEMMFYQWNNLSLIILIVSSLLVCTLSQTERINLCVTDSMYDYCLRMSDNVPGTFSCTNARDKYECMRLIDRGDADITNIDAEDLYLAGRLYGLEPFVVEEYNGNIYKYRAGVLVAKNSDISSLHDIRGKNVCLSGFGDTSGWDIPIGILLATDTLVPDCRGELYSVENFFGQSCAPGKWSEDPIVDQQLKKIHPKLCSLCKDPNTCSLSDPYAGTNGAIKCLTEGQSQVAFVTIEDAELYFRNRPEERESYQFLCLDGSRMPITRRACEWARRPTNTFVIRKGRARQKDIYLRYLQQIFFRFSQLRPSWFTRTFVSDENVTQLVSVPFNMQQWDKYLGNYIPSIEKPLPGCERKNVTFCLTSSEELSKCLELQKVAYARRIRPQIRCFNADTRKSCIDAVNNRKADIVTLEPQDFYHAARYDKLIPIAKEIMDNPDYAVAAVKANSNILSLSQLKGMRSCHTGYGRTEGWTVPVAMLIENGLLPGVDCNRAQEVSKFFSGSCVPGAADSRINSNASGVSNLCSQCIGDDSGEHECEMSNAERFNGDAGVFRCLAEGRGDVAFLNHKTPLNYTDGKSTEFWSRFLRSVDFRLLCINGENGSDRHNQLGQLLEYPNCNLAKIPGRVIVTAESTPYENRFDAVYVLTALSDMFTNKVPMSFKLFGNYKNDTNVMFGDITSRIMAVPSDTTYRDVFEQKFLHILEMNDPNVCLNYGKTVNSSQLLYLLLIILSLILYH